jgi:hypothetical protein
MTDAPKPCPVCGCKPSIDDCGPWPAGNGKVPWHVGCYKMIPTEHYVGVNGDTAAEAVANWNIEVEKINGP